MREGGVRCGKGAEGTVGERGGTARRGRAERGRAGTRGGDARRGRAGLGDAHGLAAVEGLHALDLGEGDVVARLQAMPHLVQRRHHAGVVLFGPPQSGRILSGRGGRRMEVAICLRDG